MSRTYIPFLFVRGGTSRGPYFKRSDLPADLDELSEVLMKVVGAGHSCNIDGIGGGSAVTTKVAMLSRSEDPAIDIDYFFAQVAVEKREVDFRPTCGNILSGVGPAAIEMGLVPVSGHKTQVRIRAVNTGARITAVVETPGGEVNYEGDTAIDGVPGSAAPVELKFLDVVGTTCGALLPTGNRKDAIDGVEVSCVDVAMPMMMVRASDFGLTGYESVEELNSNREFYNRVEPIRLKAGELMGMGDVSQSVTPKIGLLSKPRGKGLISVRYFMPWECHPTLAVTGSQCVTACCMLPGTVADGLSDNMPESSADISIEHPSGEIVVSLDFDREAESVNFNSFGLIRTARLLARGELVA